MLGLINLFVVSASALLLARFVPTTNEPPKTMSSQHSVRIELTVSASNPNLLEGLETWLRLGLISDAQVKQLGRIYLSCRLPEPEIAPCHLAPHPERWNPRSRNPFLLSHPYPGYGSHGKRN